MDGPAGRIARRCGKAQRLRGERVQARGYAPSVLGIEPEQVRKYIRDQEGADGRSEQF